MRTRTTAQSYLGFLLAGVRRGGCRRLILVLFVLLAPALVLQHAGRRDHPPRVPLHSIRWQSCCAREFVFSHQLFTSLPFLYSRRDPSVRGGGGGGAVVRTRRRCQGPQTPEAHRGRNVGKGVAQPVKS